VRNVERRGGTYTLLGNGGADRAGILKNPTDDWDPVWLTYFGVPIGSHGYMSVGGTRWH
jgi:hypothetical protein